MITLTYKNYFSNVYEKRRIYDKTEMTEGDNSNLPVSIALRKDERRSKCLHKYAQYIIRNSRKT